MADVAQWLVHTAPGLVVSAIVAFATGWCLAKLVVWTRRHRQANQRLSALIDFYRETQ